MARTRASHWLGTLLVCFIVALAGNTAFLLHDKLILGVDIYTHYRWAFQFHQALAEGVLYPRWMPAANYGLGEPAFIYYPPFYFYLVSGLQGVTGDLWTSMKVVAVAANFFSGIVAFAIARRALGVGWAMLVAVLVQTMPFLLFMQSYLNTFPWHASFPLILLSFLGTISPLKDFPNWRLSVVVALLTMTHILAAFMVLLCLPWAWLALETNAGAGKRLAVFTRWALSVGAGLLLAMPYLLPALTTWGLIHADAWNYSRTVDWRTSFAFPLITGRLWGVRWFGPQWVLASSVLMLAAVATMVAYRLHRRRVPLPQGLTPLLCIAWAGLFFASEVSYPLYAFLGSLRMVQYPFRFLCVAAPAATIAGVLAFRLVIQSERGLGWRAIAALSLMGSVALFGAVQMGIAREGKPPRLGPALLVQYSGAPEYYPAARQPGWKAYVDSGGLEGAALRAGGSSRILLDSSHERSWLVRSQSDMALPLPIFAYPAWRTSVDGERRPSMIDPGTGLLAVRLPAGEHRVHVAWGGLPEEREGLAIALLTAALMMGVSIRRRLVHARTGPLRSESPE